MSASNRFDRRQFLAASAVAGLATALRADERGEEAAKPAPKFNHALHKAWMGDPTEAVFTQAKAAGFEGIETWRWDVNPDDAKASRELAEKAGVRVHSVIRAWVNFNSDETAKVDKEVATIERALKAAQGYGADNILLVACSSPGPVAIPDPWTFKIETDGAGLVKKIVEGDNTKFQPYIDAQNKATQRSWEVMKRLTPTAEKTGVVIGLENVWNNLWVHPQLFKEYIDGHKHPLVRPFFDCANNVKYGPPPETWIRTLGNSIIKLHIKEYALHADGKSGEWTALREKGGINWPEVRKALDEVGFDRFGTIEGSGGGQQLSMEEQSKRFDLIVAGV
jgi:L-ribulose-5-phosphate 3-epimerase